MEDRREHDNPVFDGWTYRHNFEFDSIKRDKNINVHCRFFSIKKTFVYIEKLNFESEQALSQPAWKSETRG